MRTSIPRKASLFVLVLFVVTAPAWAQWGTPVIDGVITPGEYGNNTVGTNTAQNWYMTWDATNLYVGIANANLSEGAVIYIGPNPQSDPNCCNDRDGNLTGFTYDKTNFASLPFRAKFVTYYKDHYREYRNSDGSGGWTGAITNYGQYASGGGNVREIAIPWSAINQKGELPVHFVFFGYLTSSRGQVYGEVPNDNPGQFIGTGATYTQYYNISNTGNGPVHIEQVIADHKSYDASSGLRLPPLVRDLTIGYTGLSFVAPEKVLFRYKLEGRDREWQDVGNRRQAYYNDLSPGKYRFRVAASNNNGVWNEAGTFLDFSIAPAYYQTNWFRLFCVIAFMAMLWGLYRLRVRQLAKEFNTGLEARVSERTRIARELHDTLLQSFHGLLLRFQTVSNMLPVGDAKQKLASAIDQAAQAITESRDAVQELRRSTVVPHDLAASINVLGQDLAAAESCEDSVVFRVTVEGTPRTLHLILRDELYRIAGEALRNAFRHAAARQIEVEIRYDERQLHIHIRDDGRGINPKVLKKGQPDGHYGLQGMRERSKLIGGTLTVWSEIDSGTEVELSIPASNAYEKSSASRHSSLIEKLKEKFSGKDRAIKS